MSKVTLVFPREMKYRGEIIAAGEHEFDTSEKAPGFVDRWLRRGCHVKDDSSPKNSSEVDNTEEGKGEVIEEVVKTEKDILREQCQAKGIEFRKKLGC